MDLEDYKRAEKTAREMYERERPHWIQHLRQIIIEEYEVATRLPGKPLKHTLAEHLQEFEDAFSTKGKIGELWDSISDNSGASNQKEDVPK